jgi:hemerythrin|tara:strand:- start:1016 stop:1483 length:468 start_codon:yes stop_codon:yes gene_type:complete
MCKNQDSVMISKTFRESTMIDFHQLPKVELDFMNTEHQEAVDIYNKIERDYLLHDVDSVINGILDIQEHCISHFAHEEQVMKNNCYPPLQVHKEAHDRVLMEIDMVVKQLKNHRDLSKIAHYIERGFPNWFSQHLNTMDKMAAEFISGQKLRKVS